MSSDLSISVMSTVTSKHGHKHKLSFLFNQGCVQMSPKYQVVACCFPGYLHPHPFPTPYLAPPHGDWNSSAAPEA